MLGTEDRGSDKRTLSAHEQEILNNFLAAFGGDALGDLEPVNSADKPIAPTDRDPGSTPAIDVNVPATTECDGGDLP